MFLSRELDIKIKYIVSVSYKARGPDHCFNFKLFCALYHYTWTFLKRYNFWEPLLVFSLYKQCRMKDSKLHQVIISPTFWFSDDTVSTWFLNCDMICLLLRSKLLTLKQFYWSQECYKKFSLARSDLYDKYTGKTDDWLGSELGIDFSRLCTVCKTF